MIKISNINEKRPKVGWQLISKNKEKELIKSIRNLLWKKGLDFDIKSER